MQIDRRSAQRLITGAVFAILLAAMALLSASLENSAQFGRLYSAVLVLTVSGVVALAGLIGLNLYRLVQQYRGRAPGSRITARLVVLLVVLTVMPVSLVYYFSVGFLDRGIESWFDVRVEKALRDALELSRTALSMRQRELLRQVQQAAEDLTQVPDGMAALAMDDARDRLGASELGLVAQGGQVVALSAADPTALVPTRVDDSIQRQARQGHAYVGLTQGGVEGLNVQVVVAMASQVPGTDSRLLQALFPVTERVGALADSVQSAYVQYRELAYLRIPLKQSFILSLSLILLVTILAAVWAAFFTARRLVAPIRDLAAATRAVAAGDYTERVRRAARDELGFLVSSFNEMIRQIARARDEVQQSREEAESGRAYLQAVVEHLSSGVFTLDEQHHLRTVNRAACEVLGVELEALVGRPLEAIAETYPHLGEFVAALEPHLAGGQGHWRQELALTGRGQQVLMCRGRGLEGVGYVVVFEDITALIQAQRNAAWAEVARRLAHEIKNPLTPIQLSAERLRHKYLRSMTPGESELMDRLTQTIIQQVESLKSMVNAFSEYARMPRMQRRPTDLNQLVGDVLEMYRGSRSHVDLRVELEPGLPPVDVDGDRIRQILHNLVRNAQEASEASPAWVLVSTHRLSGYDSELVELRVEDRGRGIPESILTQLFEPYVTTKRKGTGLGLAIVKKIVDEHGGSIAAENLADGGARIILRLPVEPPAEVDAAQHVAGAENGA